MNSSAFALCLLGGLSLISCKRETPAPGSALNPAPPAPSSEQLQGKIEFPEVPIRAAAQTTVHVAWKTPQGTGVNEEAPFRVRWARSDALEAAPADVKATGSAARDGFNILVKPLSGAPNATLSGTIDVVVCDVLNHSVCVPVHREVDIEFVVSKDAATQTTVHIPLPQVAQKRGN